ncbi:Abhydrolase domain-containing protein lid-1 [Caenorhabditis elegans]|uniref:Abhydrolase domain-containing protein lid-1 n=1 Tax=Caenorhabditis elegans TaxID=6239 RepID=LID1_CAEEL|nr:Abhydrolase domain-containing protein lid-1 [Caenorhabditis elegans]O02218.2 RecName: Full=Abhydrolase domain-containing protein lid-1; AltName: Full=Lipid droplet protein 1 [Caenorhabditis elegans]CAB02763.2 Abhydrolase domain-containing protein lid-1 [Caenorhabditis elegans]|eukprot:NP_492685.2 Abhydrolase domain-containing protein lid-1 [Caenorhabditis elegans]
MAIATTKTALTTIMNWMTFTDDSKEQLKIVEGRLFQSCEVSYEAKYVPVRFKRGEVYTVTVRPREAENLNGEAIVFIPGLGAGVAMFTANFNSCAKNHAVHSFDPLGFGRSSRSRFSDDNAIAELEMVEVMEDWRKAMGIEKMYIIGHAFGGYLASAYALENPSRVAHLILVDPWGFAEKVETTEKLIKPYAWMSFLGGVAGYFNPFSPMRWMGPYAPAIVKKLRPDLLLRFPGLHDYDIYKYVYYLNLPNPTGETAFMNMTLPVGWAKRPMIKRFNGIDKNVGVSFIYGSKSWIDPGPAIDIQSTRENAYVDIKIVRGAGTHVYADDPAAFNEIVSDVVEGRLSNPSNDFEIEECCHSD